MLIGGYWNGEHSVVVALPSITIMRTVSRTSAFITARSTEGPTRPYTQLTNTDYFLQSAATVLWKLPNLWGSKPYLLWRVVNAINEANMGTHFMVMRTRTPNPFYNQVRCIAHGYSSMRLQYSQRLNGVYWRYSQRSLMLIVGVMVMVESGSDESWRVLKRRRTHQLQHWVGGKRRWTSPPSHLWWVKSSFRWL